MTPIDFHKDCPRHVDMVWLGIPTCAFCHRRITEEERDRFSQWYQREEDVYRQGDYDDRAPQPDPPGYLRGEGVKDR